MKRKYPWEEWLNKPRTVILRGVHYNCSQSAMTQAIRNNASQRGILVRLIDTDTEIIIEVKGESNKRQTVPDVRSDMCSERVTTT